jgi:hypothetical protein
MLVKGMSILGGALLTAPAQTKAETWEDYKLYQILQDFKTIPGPFRYIAVTNGGAVLETAGLFTNLVRLKAVFVWTLDETIEIEALTAVAWARF